jgi:16S rRNA (cytidine1402-2'-O)-methyltransferase
VSGRVVVVGTPIGNLGDLSPRAADALSSAAVVACEDTRRTGRLLGHLGLDAPRLVRLDDHTEPAAAPVLVERAAAGDVVVVVSDAGMPGVSDPGNRVVSLARERGVPVEVVPGPFAGVVAAVASGLLDPAGRFAFEGFLPRKGSERVERLARLAGERRTLVLYEAPHRLVRTLADLRDHLGGGRRVAVCRELTKLHEEVWVGELAGAAAHWEHTGPRGEFVVVVEGAPPPVEVDDEVLRAELERLLAEGCSGRDAAAHVAARFDAAPNRVKRLLHRG